MKTTKSRIFSILLLVLIIFSLFNLFPLKALASELDFSYTFETEILYNSDSIIYNESFNVRNPTPFTEIYNGSYSFTNGTIPLSWIDNSDINCYTSIVSLIDGHSEVLYIYDNNNSGIADITSYFSAQSYGTIEFWFRTTDISKVQYIRGVESGNQKFVMRFFDSAIDYHNGGNWIELTTATSNIWYHIRIDFECSGGSYLGLSADSTDIYVNGKLKASDGSFSSTATNIDGFNVFTTSTNIDYGSYLDGVGYHWLSNYTIGLNIIPTNIIDIFNQEVDKYEFALNGVNTFNQNGDDDLNGWSDFEVTPSADRAYSTGETDGSYDRQYLTQATGLSNAQGIEKTFNLDNSNFYNITISTQFIVFDGITNIALLEIDSFDGNDISIIRIQADFDIEYKDNTGYHQCTTDIELVSRYEFNIFLNYEIDRVNLIITKFDLFGLNGVVVETREYNMITNNKYGIQDIKIWNLLIDANQINMIIDYVGIYSAGISQVGKADDFGINTIELNNNWNFKNNNLLSIITNGSFALGAINGSYSGSSTLHDINNIRDYNSTEIFYNIYDAYKSVISVPSFLFTIVGSYFNVSYINVEGVSLKEGLNTYYLEFTHSGINTNESYFYVDINNKLQFTHIANDTNLEYIQAEFNILDVSSLNYAVKFRSDIDNIAKGFFRVNFTDISDFIPIPIFDTTTRIFISQNKTISSFIILITDDNIDSVLGTTEGYLNELELLYISGIGVSITTTNLLTLMIPIIIILIPTFLLSSKFGKNSIVPLFILFSLIITISEIIPLWLFFIIIIPSSLFLFLKRKEGVF